MNIKLFFLIHNEKSYKRYYYQSLKHDNFIYRSLFSTYFLCSRYMAAVKLPFNSKYNTQQFPGERKPKIQMLFESLCWTFKYKEVCNYYFLYGLDIKSRSPKDYVAYSEFRVLRNIINFRIRENLRTLYTFNYLALTRDKFVFYQYCKALDMPYPNTIALVSKSKISWYDGKNGINFININAITTRNFDAFCKEVNGESGKGAFGLKVMDGDCYVNGEKKTINDIEQLFGDVTFIIQEKLKNHPSIDKIYTKSLNTLKLITFLKDNGEVEFFDGVMRFGAGGNIVDNASRGGIFVGIDEHGSLQEVGYHEPGIKKKLVVNGYHPDTNEKFGGMRLPFWDEMLAKAKTFHQYFYGVPSIGWDVAFTPDGFVFTEIGEDWEIPLYQVTNGPKREQFYRLHGNALNIKLRKY